MCWWEKVDDLLDSGRSHVTYLITGARDLRKVPGLGEGVWEENLLYRYAKNKIRREPKYAGKVTVKYSGFNVFGILELEAFRCLDDSNTTLVIDGFRELLVMKSQLESFFKYVRDNPGRVYVRGRFSKDGRPGFFPEECHSPGIPFRSAAIRELANALEDRGGPWHEPASNFQEPTPEIIVYTRGTAFDPPFKILCWCVARLRDQYPGETVYVTHHKPKKTSVGELQSSLDAKFTPGSTVVCLEEDLAMFPVSLLVMYDFSFNRCLAPIAYRTRARVWALVKDKLIIVTESAYYRDTREFRRFDNQAEIVHDVGLVAKSKRECPHLTVHLEPVVVVKAEEGGDLPQQQKEQDKQ